MSAPELFEIVSSLPTSAIADCWRLLAAYGGVRVADTVLSTPQEAAGFTRTLRGVQSLPVLFDNLEAVEIAGRLTATQHLAAACGCLGEGVRERTRAAYAAELVLAWQAASGHADLATSQRHLRTLAGIISRFAYQQAPAGGAAAAAGVAAPSGPTNSLTYGDLLAWLYVDSTVASFGEEAALSGLPALAGFHRAVGGLPEVKVFVEAKAKAKAAAEAAASGASAAAAASSLPAPAAAAAAASRAAPKQPPVKGPVCVTGATGFIASWVVKILLELGYTVHGTVRNLSSSSSFPPHKAAHLLELPFADARLRLFDADLLTPGSFDEAIKGCTAVIHAASPFYAKAEDPVKEFLEPAVHGTQNVLRACIAAPTVSRVVVTSSVAAIYVSRNAPDYTYSEADWSDLEYIRETKNHYGESKLLAEREAWRILREEVPAGRALPLTMATICPTQTLGPLLQPYVNQSSSGILELMNGSKAKVPNKTKCFVDVRDVALAHVLASERASAANKRYLLISSVAAWRTVCDLIRSTLRAAAAEGGGPDGGQALLTAEACEALCAKVPSEVEDGGKPAPYPQALFSTAGVYELGIRYRPLEHSLRDAVLSLVESGFAK
jgi:nucleoside-diphosphate-sugar epimerase